MKRRRFVRELFAVPAAPLVAAAAQQAAVAAQSAPPSVAPTKAQAAGQPAATPERGLFRQPEGIPKLAVVETDLVSQTDQQFFTPEQFATLEKLADLLMPPLKKHPGAREAHAPEFLDFLISVSPAERQELYRSGLDGLTAAARERFRKGFSELDAKEADGILRPLLVARPWAESRPADPLKNFVSQVHDDLREATENSREWAEATPEAGRRRGRGFVRTVGYYWKPVDPVVRD